MTACRFRLTLAQRLELAAPLGRFLAALHAIDTRPLLAEGLGLDTLERTNVLRQRTKAEHSLEALLGSGGPWERAARQGLAALEIAWEALSSDASQAGARQRTLVHGDLYGRHLLLDSEGRLTGVIDWGDVHAGDAALDLALASSFLPREAHAAFRAAYGGPDEPTWARARFRAVHHSAVLLYAGAASGDAALAGLAEQSFAWLHAT